MRRSIHSRRRICRTIRRSNDANPWSRALNQSRDGQAVSTSVCRVSVETSHRVLGAFAILFVPAMVRLQPSCSPGAAHTVRQRLILHQLQTDPIVVPPSIHYQSVRRTLSTFPMCSHAGNNRMTGNRPYPHSQSSGRRRRRMEWPSGQMVSTRGYRPTAES